MNIVLVTIDCLRYDRCGHNGYRRNTTPNIDNLCSDAYVFRSAVSPGPRTSESIPGILSGRLSCECRFINELSFKKIPNDAETLATFASKKGYRTVATVSNPQLSPIRGFDLGFDVFDNLRIEDSGDRFNETTESGNKNSETTGTPLMTRLGSKLLDYGDAIPINLAKLAFVAYRHRQLRSGWPTVNGQRVLDRFTDNIPNDNQFFGWMHLNDIHAPIHPQRARNGGLISATDTRQFLSDSDRVQHEENLLHDLMYDSIVRYVDNQVGRLVEYLAEQGIRNETAIIVTSDHGEALYDRGIYGHASGREQRLYESDRDYLYRELLDVPLVVDIPGEKGNEIKTPFSLIWLHQILADIIGSKSGDFPRSASYSERVFDTDDTVFADAITEQGHTVAGIDSAHKIITDGTSPDSIQEENWHSLSKRDQGDRVHVSYVPRNLKDRIKRTVVDYRSLEQSDNRIREETMEQLSNLGYK